MAEQPIELVYGVDPPALVYVTVDAARPVQSALTFNFANTSGAAIEFVNPAGLTPGDPLPAYSETAPNPLSRVYVWAPWGDTAGDLATDGNGTSIVASSQDSDWDVSKQLSDPTLGYYWILFPKSKSVFLQANQSVSFDFSGIVAYLPQSATTKMTWIKAQPRVQGYGADSGTVVVWKQTAMATLTPARSRVYPGSTVGLTWATSGAASCEIDWPGGQLTELKPNGTTSVTVPARPSTEYKLRASWTIGATAAASCTVATETGWFQLGPVPGAVEGGASTPIWLRDRLLLLKPGGDCWTSADGAAWQQVASTPGPLGADDAWLPVVSGRRAWLFVTDGLTGQQHLYSTPDGMSWTLVGGPLPWSWNGSTAQLFTVRPAAYGGLLWAFTPPPNSTQGPQTVWSSPDGVAWSQRTVAPFATKWPPFSAEFAGRLWTLGGTTFAIYPREVWSTTDGVNWLPQTPVGWSEQRFVWAVAASRSHLYALTASNKDGGGTQLWQMDREQRWTTIALPPELTATYLLDLGIGGWGDFLVAVNTAGNVWLYVPDLEGRRGG
jgi:hypothetical protein